MLTSKLEKAPTKAEMEKKVEAWKTLNSVLVKSSAELMNSLRSMLSSKEATSNNALSASIFSMVTAEEVPFVIVTFAVSASS